MNKYKDMFEGVDLPARKRYIEASEEGDVQNSLGELMKGFNRQGIREGI